ncbi:MAG: rhodanese-like domain-containing protein [Pseudomonadota bacterium]|jgi:rhodanese-related sulfurtransferase
MSEWIDPRQLKAWLHDGQEIALLDVREQGEYGEAHLFFGVPLPYSRLELDIARMVPRLSTRLVVYDADGAGVAIKAAQRLTAMGYSQVRVLQGGTAAWQAAGHALFAGVNLPSKTFGELAEHAYATPSVSADELAAWLAAKEDVVVLDGRPLAEFKKMSIPGATCCPNGELAYRVRHLVPSEKTRIVINCAGRTRSIIGAQTLINLGLPNPVFALRNGTQGWYLEDHVLEHGKTQAYGPPADVERMQAAASSLAARVGVQSVSDDTVMVWAEDTTRSLFLCDVRTPEEFAQGSLPGAQHTPGGQLMQAMDLYVGVRNARLVLFDSDGVRALTVASWLVQMGHDVHVLEKGLQSGVVLARRGAFPVPLLEPISAADLKQQLALNKIRVLDVRSSMQYRAAHIPGAQWSIRPVLDQALAQENRPVVFVADDSLIAACAATEMAHVAQSYWLDGGLQAWQAAGYPVEATPDTPPDSACIDFLFFVHDRHDGNKAAARQYLAWETHLVSQLDAQEIASFRLPQPTQLEMHP